MMRRHGEGCLSDLRLDRSLSGESSPDEQRAIDAHVLGCDRCRTRQAELLESRQSFVRDAPPWTTFDEQQGKRAPDARLGATPLRERATSPHARRGPLPRGWLGASSLLAVAAAIALAVSQPWTRSDRGTLDLADGETRAKGGAPTLGWVVRRGERVFAGQPEQRLRAGDAVRFTVSISEVLFVAVVGLDGSGRVSVYHSDGERLSRVEPGRDRPLSTAIELDARPGEERLYGVFCSSPVSLAQVTAAVERAPDSPALPPECTVVRSTLGKEAR